MTNKEKKDILNNYREYVRQEKILNDAYEYTLAKAFPGSPNLDGMPHGNSPVDLSDYVVKLYTLLDELRQISARKHEALHAITTAIEKMDDEREKTVLMLRYIGGYRFPRVAHEMGLSLRTVTGIHGSALAHFEPGVKEWTQ